MNLQLGPHYPKGRHHAHGHKAGGPHAATCVPGGRQLPQPSPAHSHQQSVPSDTSAKTRAWHSSNWRARSRQHAVAAAAEQRRTSAQALLDRDIRACNTLQQLLDLLKENIHTCNQVNTFSATCQAHRLLRQEEAAEQRMNGRQQHTTGHKHRRSKPQHARAAQSSSSSSSRQDSSLVELLQLLAQLTNQHATSFTPRHCVAILTAHAWMCSMTTQTHAVVQACVTSGTQVFYTSNLVHHMLDAVAEQLVCSTMGCALHQASKNNHWTGQSQKPQTSVEQHRVTSISIQPEKRGWLSHSHNSTPANLSRAVWALAKLGHYHSQLIELASTAVLAAAQQQACCHQPLNSISRSDGVSARYSSHNASAGHSSQDASTSHTSHGTDDSSGNCRAHDDGSSSRMASTSLQLHSLAELPTAQHAAAKGTSNGSVVPEPCASAHTVSAPSPAWAPTAVGSGTAVYAWDEGTSVVMAHLMWAIGQLQPLAAVQALSTQSEPVSRLPGMALCRFLLQQLSSEHGAAWLSILPAQEAANLLHGLARYLTSVQQQQDSHVGEDPDTLQGESLLDLDSVLCLVPGALQQACCWVQHVSTPSSVTDQAAVNGSSSRPAMSQLQPHVLGTLAHALSSLSLVTGHTDPDTERDVGDCTGGTTDHVATAAALSAASKSLAGAAAAADMSDFSPRDVSHLLGLLGQAQTHIAHPQSDMQAQQTISEPTANVHEQQGGPSLLDDTGVQGFVLQALQYVAQHAQQLTAQDVCEISFAFAQLGLTAPSSSSSSRAAASLLLTTSSAVQVLGTTSVRLAVDIPLTRLITLVWSLARLEVTPPALLATLASRIHTATTAVPASSLSQPARQEGVSTSGAAARPADAPYDLANDLEASDISRLCWALAQYARGSTASMQWHAQQLQQVSDGPDSIAQVLGSSDVQWLLSELESAAALHAPDMDDQSLVLTLWALCTLERPCADFLQEAAPILQQRIKPFAFRTNTSSSNNSNSGASSIDSGKATGHGHNGPIHQVLSAHHLALCVWCVARCISGPQATLRDMAPLQLLHQAAPVLAGVVGQLTGRGLAMVAAAYAHAQENPGDTLLRALWQEAGSRIAAGAHDMDTPSLSMLVWGLAQFKPVEPQLLAQLATAVVARVAGPAAHQLPRPARAGGGSSSSAIASSQPLAAVADASASSQQLAAVAGASTSASSQQLPAVSDVVEGAVAEQVESVVLPQLVNSQQLAAARPVLNQSVSSPAAPQQLVTAGHESSAVITGGRTAATNSTSALQLQKPPARPTRITVTTPATSHTQRPAQQSTQHPTQPSDTVQHGVEWADEMMGVPVGDIDVGLPAGDPHLYDHSSKIDTSVTERELQLRAVVGLAVSLGKAHVHSPALLQLAIQLLLQQARLTATNPGTSQMQHGPASPQPRHSHGVEDSSSYRARPAHQQKLATYATCLLWAVSAVRHNCTAWQLDALMQLAQAALLPASTQQPPRAVTSQPLQPADGNALMAEQSSDAVYEASGHATSNDPVLTPQAPVNATQYRALKRTAVAVTAAGGMRAGGMRQGPGRMDVRLLSMLLQALPVLRYQPPPEWLAAACARLLQPGAMQKLSTHTLCEVIWAFAALQYAPPKQLVSELVSIVEQRVLVTRQELTTVPSTVKLAWGLAYLRFTRHRLFKHAAATVLSCSPHAFQDNPPMLRMLLEVKMMCEWEARSDGFWRALSRRWQERCQAGAPEYLTPSMIIQGYSTAAQQALDRAIRTVPHVLQGLGYSQVEWAATPQGELVCHFTATRDQLIAAYRAQHELRSTASQPEGHEQSHTHAAAVPGARMMASKDRRGYQSSRVGVVKLALVVVCPWHLSVNQLGMGLNVRSTDGSMTEPNSAPSDGSTEKPAAAVVVDGLRPVGATHPTQHMMLSGLMLHMRLLARQKHVVACVPLEQLVPYGPRADNPVQHTDEAMAAVLQWHVQQVMAAHAARLAARTM